MVTLAPLARACRLATAVFSNGQPAVSTAMTATTIASQRSLTRVAAGARPRPVWSATTKQLTQAAGAVTEDRDSERGNRHDDDGSRDQPQVTRRQRDGVPAVLALTDRPDWQAEHQHDEACHKAELEHGPADRSEAEGG